MKARWCVVLLLSISALRAFPQAAPKTISLCDLVANPESYDRQQVRVRASVPTQFEDFSFDRSECGIPATRDVWLTYAGDAYYEPARNLKLVDDSRLADFKRFAFAERSRRPDGKECYSRQCYFYVVTATFEGVFFARSSEKTYGHMGCCHLFVITKVEEVSPERTKVPEEGAYQCSTHSVALPADESKRRVSNNNGYAQFCELLREDISRVFNNDPPVPPFKKADFNPGHVAQAEPYPDTWEWLSDDLLTIYTITLEPNRREPGYLVTGMKVKACTRK